MADKISTNVNISVDGGNRDLKVDKINIRPIFHRNSEQTRGHVFISMFSYAIIKELEIGYKMKKLMIPQLTPIQKEIFSNPTVVLDSLL